MRSKRSGLLMGILMVILLRGAEGGFRMSSEIETRVRVEMLGAVK